MSWQIYGSKENKYLLLIARGLAFRIQELPPEPQRMAAIKTFGWVFGEQRIEHRTDGDYGVPSLGKMWREGHGDL